MNESLKISVEVKKRIADGGTTDNTQIRQSFQSRLDEVSKAICSVPLLSASPLQSPDGSVPQSWFGPTDRRL